MATLDELVEAATRRPGDAGACYALGVAYAARGEWANAFALLRRACAAGDRPKYHATLGFLLGRAPGCEDEATSHLERAFERRPKAARLGEELGWQYAMAVQRPSDARALSARLIAAHPDRPRSYIHLSHAALALAADDPERLAAGWLPPNGRTDLLRWGVAKALTQVGRYREARTRLRRTLSRRPPDARALALLASVEETLGDGEAARRWCRQAVALAPNDVEVLDQYRALLWRSGDHLGVRRFLRTPATAAAFEIPPVWDASSIRGRTVLLAGSGGFGDSVLWSRAAFLLREQGAAVVIECQAPLRRLLTTIGAADAAVAPGDPYPACDLRCTSSLAMQSLEWELAALDAHVPYVCVPAATAWKWKRRVGDSGKLHVGLAWRTETDKWVRHDPYLRRSIPFGDLQPLGALGGVVFHSLHVGDEGLRELRAGASRLAVSDLSRGFGDFADTAAAIGAMDVVVSVDTAVAHVAGALNTPTLLLLPYRADWRWGDPSTPTRWYPACRSFRQTSPGGWSGVVREVAAELRRIGAGRVRPATQAGCVS